jgi:hypothetical protein
MLPTGGTRVILSGDYLLLIWRGLHLWRHPHLHIAETLPCVTV